MNKLIGYPKVLCMEDSNYKWGIGKSNLYECGVTTFVTLLLWILFYILCLWVMEGNEKV